MEIIKKGTLANRNEVRFFTCPNCGCEFIANSIDDLKTDRDGDYVNCPTCHFFLAWQKGRTYMNC